MDKMCPLTGKPCSITCAWYMSGTIHDCAVAKLADKTEELAKNVALFGFNK